MEKVAGLLFISKFFKVFDFRMWNHPIYLSESLELLDALLMTVHFAASAFHWTTSVLPLVDDAYTRLRSTEDVG